MKVKMKSKRPQDDPLILLKLKVKVKESENEIQKTLGRSPYLVLSTASPPGSGPTRCQPLGKSPEHTISVKVKVNES